MVGRRNLCWASAVLILAVCVWGCGSELPFDAARVTGTVTYRGKPLDHGEVVFVPAPGSEPNTS